jgi:ATP-binding cassette, subfamily F, member 3
MPIIINDLCLSFGDRVIFNSINFSIDYSEKIGLLGRNGSGKSTLLKIIAGHDKPNSGSVSYDKKKTVRYLPQELVLESTKTVFNETLDVFSSFLRAKQEMHEIENRLETGVDDTTAASLTDRYAILQEHYAHFDENQALMKAERILKGLGFSEHQRNQSVDTLSVGWKMRVSLAKLLLQEADFYLFDEPTNHLDLTTKEWFFSFLKEGDFGYLLVTHDKYFLSHSCEKIVEIERSAITVYKGGFSSYLEQKEKRQEEVLAAYKLQQKEIARKQETINRFRAQATKAAMVQSMIKDLEKMERIEIESTMPTVHFSFADVVRAGKIVLEINKVCHSFDDTPLFNNASCNIMRGKKVALIAPNGTGKTTLFNLIVGNLALQHGTIILGHNVAPAYFQQDQTRVMNKNNSVLQEVLDACRHVPEAKIRSFLGAFLFSGDDVKKKIYQLSGGEKNRVAMVKVLLQDANLLLLDEPTNHLDIYAKEVLQQALQQYKGTILFVSHDHDFVQHVADTILELTPSGLYAYDGTYESYLYHRKLISNSTKEIEVIAQSTLSNKQSKDFQCALRERQLKKQVRSLEEQIKKLEKKQEMLAQQLSEFAYGTNEYEKIISALTTIDTEIKSSYDEWEQIMKQMVV